MRVIHGGDIYRNQVEYDFSININPLGMPAESIRAAEEAIHLCGRYPDDRSEELCQAIAGKEKVSVNQILAGNGAAELIYSLCHYLRPRRALCFAPTFQEYESAVLSVGGDMHDLPLKRENDFSLQEDILKTLKTALLDVDVLFFCNPNNPTGRLTDKGTLIKIAERCEETDTYFCLDECFLPFLAEEEAVNMKSLLNQFPHMIILRAFTKVYGMPGLRLGYALSANHSLLKGMRNTIQPWNISLPAQMAGVAALNAGGYLEETRKLIAAEREYLLKELSKGLADYICPSNANFIFFHASAGLKDKLLQEKILIRDCSNFHGLESGYYRICIRTHQENEELIKRWKKVLQK